jgi:uncharacterized membrane protein
MPHFLDPRWLLVLPLVSVIVFIAWVLWNVSREIRKERRKRSGGAGRREDEHFY